MMISLSSSLVEVVDLMPYLTCRESEAGNR